MFLKEFDICSFKKHPSNGHGENRRLLLEFIVIIIIILIFLGLHPQYMEVSRPGVESELQLLAYPTAHSDVGSEPRLRPTPQLTAPPDP